MITIDFNKRGNTGLGEYIYECIKKNIKKGVLCHEEKLPSKRALAEHLGVSVITVQNAYGLLIDEGWIYSVEKKGFFVSDSSVIPVAEKNPAKKMYVEKYKAPKKEKELIADFTSSSCGVNKFPFALWARLTREILNTQNERLLARCNAFGLPELRKAIARYLLEFRGMIIDENQIVIGAGTESLYAMIVQLLGKNSIYAVENPGYHKVGKIIELNGAECVHINIDLEGLNPELLEKQNADVVHVSPLHHFPTGIVMPVWRRNELLKWASEKKDRYIIEDDYDSEFRFTRKPLPTLQSSDFNGKVIYINTFSKTLAPSFRMSYMVLPQELVQLYQSRLGIYSCAVSTLEQFTLAEFISKGHYGKHITRMKNYYRTLRNDLIRELNRSRLSSIAEIHEAEAGLHFLLEVPARLDDEKIRQLLLKKGIRISMLKDFYYDGKSIPYENRCIFVMNYSALKKEQIPLTVKIMEKIITGSSIRPE